MMQKNSPKYLLKLIQRARNFLKKDQVFKDMCKEYDLNTDIVDLIPIRFGNIDVSAKTVRGIIILNYKLLDNFFNNIHYLEHESQHWLDQCFGDTATKGATNGDYLHNPDEQKAFKKQIHFIDDQFGEDEAEKYVDHLLDHHDKKGKERKSLEKVLMEDCED